MTFQARTWQFYTLVAGSAVTACMLVVGYLWLRCATINIFKMILKRLEMIGGMHEPSVWEVIDGNPRPNPEVPQRPNPQIGRDLLLALFPPTPKKVAVLGFRLCPEATVKSPMIIVATMLKQQDILVHIFDPYADSNQIHGCFEYHKIFANRNRYAIAPTPWEAAKGASAIVVLADWPEIRRYPYPEIRKMMRQPAFIFDHMSVLRGIPLERMGFTLIGAASEPSGPAAGKLDPGGGIQVAGFDGIIGGAHDYRSSLLESRRRSLGPHVM